jgi:hypothetical protein
MLNESNEPSQVPCIYLRMDFATLVSTVAYGSEMNVLCILQEARAPPSQAARFASVPNRECRSGPEHAGETRAKSL